jgi:hypothetical protein
MKSTDKFLLGIVAGVVILVVVSLVIALRQPDQPAYDPDDTPAGVAHNYLLALQLEDYPRAYGYLSPLLLGYPADAEAFKRKVLDNPYWFGLNDDEVSLAIEGVNVTNDLAEVVMRRTVFYRGSLFDSGQYSDTFDMSLLQVDGNWKIVGSDRYWDHCWNLIEGCP